MITLIRTRGFPAQKIIGTQNGDDSLFQIGPNAVAVTYIFIHHTNGWPLVSTLLGNELSKGNTTPQMYGVIYESSNGKRVYDNPVRYFASRPCGDRKCKGPIRNHLCEINEARWSIGLGTYEVMEKKFESRKQYATWCKEDTRMKAPFFDFQCEQSFQSRQ